MHRILLAFLSTGIIQITNFASGIALARLLGAGMRGEVAQIIAWFGFVAPVAMLGINDGITFLRARYPEASGNVLSTGLSWLIVSAAIGTIVASGVVVFVLGDLSHISRIAAWTFLLFVPLYQLQQSIFSYFQGGTETAAWTIVRCIPGLVYIAGLLIISLLGIANPLTVICANLIGLFSCIIAGFIFAFRGGIRLTRPDPAMSQTLLKYSAPLVFQKLAVVCRDNLDRMILSVFIASAALGHYVVASSVAYLIYIVGLTIDLVGFPAMVRAKNDEARRTTAEFFISATFWLLLAAVVILIPLREPIVTFLFGPEFAQSASLVPYFLIAGALQALRMVVGGAFKAFGSARALAGIEILSAVVMFVILITMTAQFGVFAGVLAHLISSFLAVMLALILAVRVLKLSPLHILLPRRSDIARTSTQFREFASDFRKRD